MRKLTEDEQRIVEANMPLVSKMAQRYHGDRNYEDIKSSGWLGLIMAVQSYNPEIGELSTYACTCIAREMSDEKKKLRSIFRASWSTHPAKGRPEPSQATLDARERIVNMHRVEWADADAEAVLAVELPAEIKDFGPLYREIDGLDARSQAIVTETVMGNMTLHKTGESLGVCQERIRQIQSKALHTLKRRLMPFKRIGAL